MRVGVWGAGEVGSAMVYRLASSPFIPELFWINRSLGNIECRCLDIRHGLAFAPCCHRITACSQESVAKVLPEIEILILTLGGAVQEGGSREDLYPKNAGMYEESILPALRDFRGIVIVVTNPVDLMARKVALGAALPPQRVIGLGTLVETARLRASLASYIREKPPAREIPAFAIGTHDKNFVPVLPPDWAMGLNISAPAMAIIREDVWREVADGPVRVKKDKKSTIYPVVEGVVAVVEAVASDSHSNLTVSTMDPGDPDQLFYSLPCVVGREGVINRSASLAQLEPAKTDLQAGVETMRALLKRTAV